MMPVRQSIGGLGNLLFKEAYLRNEFFEGRIPDIYLQSEKYFEKHKEKIRSVFGSSIGFIDKIAVHVRRGDYVNNPFYVDLFLDGYYDRAMNVFPVKNEYFLVFSDDIEWCKEQSTFKGCEFSEGFSEIDDLNRMASCQAHIIANSSYSWWGAYLSPYGGQVMAPEKWYSDSVQRTELLKEWKTI